MYFHEQAHVICPTQTTQALPILESQIRAKLHDAGEDPFYLIDLETACERYRRFKESLPCVVPYYAVKCNSCPALLHTLDRLGTGFDCASKEEIDRILDMGVDPSRMIFANPCKMASHITHAKLRSVSRMTFDNEDELIKVSRLFPEAQLVLRIATDDSHSLCRFSAKFGARLSSVEKLLTLAHELGLHVVGVSFHVGSGCEDASSFASAARDALYVFNLATQLGLPPMRLLDIGGGFQGIEGERPLLSEVATHLLPVLQQFPAGTEFIAEPGRYFAASTHTLVTSVHSRRIIRSDNGSIQQVLYYINEGVYHSFNGLFFDHQHYSPRVLRDENGVDRGEQYTSTVFGPTCDGLDCICQDHPMPLLEVGDTIYWTNMGAYTTAALTRFNGFSGALSCYYTWGQHFIENVMMDLESDEFPGLPSKAKQLPACSPLDVPSFSPAQDLHVAPPEWITQSPEPPPMNPLPAQQWLPVGSMY